MQWVVVMIPCHVQVTFSIYHYTDDIMGIIGIALISGPYHFPFIRTQLPFCYYNVLFLVVVSGVLCIVVSDQRVSPKDGNVYGVVGPSVANGAGMCFGSDGLLRKPVNSNYNRKKDK
jgi:hypothetical protein